MIKLLEDIKSLMAAEDFDAALRKLAEIDLRDNPYLLLRAATCEQLAERGSLERARSHLEELVSRYPDFVKGLIELGYFKFAMEDDAISALAVFDLAITQARKHEQEASVGKAKCLFEMGDSVGALKAVEELHLPPEVEGGILAELDLKRS